jgi:hypothetical protein
MAENGEIGISTPIAPGAINRSTRDPDPEAGQIARRERFRRDDDGAEPAADRRAVRQHLVARGDRRVDPDRDRDDIRARVDRHLVQRRGVIAPVDKSKRARVDGAGAQRVEHERIVRVDRVGERDRVGAIVGVRHATRTMSPMWAS